MPYSRLTCFRWISMRKRRGADGKHRRRDRGWEQLLCLCRLNVTFIYWLWFSSEECYVCVIVCCMASKCWPCSNHKCGILRFINHNAVLYTFTKLSEHLQSSSKFFDAQANVIGLVLFFPLDIFNIYRTAFPNKMPKP